jgi:dihydrofolate synthase/folylpolyglutamate synthase
VNDSFILDGAHNTDAIQSLAETWREVYGHEQPTIVFGTVEGKELDAMAEILCSLTDRFIATQADNARAVTAADIARALRMAGARGITECPDLADALEAASRENGKTLITGSLFLVGEALAKLTGDPAAVEKSSQ